VKVFIDMKLINQLSYLLEEEGINQTPNSSSKKLITFLTDDEGAAGEAVLYTYDDGYYNDPPKKYDSSRYKGGKPKGTLTIGYGHTGKEAYEGNIITQEKALTLLKEDLKYFDAGINRILNAWTTSKLPGAKLNQCQYDALVSLAFNGGIPTVRLSEWIQDVKYGRFKKASEKIKSWNCPFGVCKRRVKESNLFSNCEY
jgi:GH24 family phage-related lysozyme (muramidase)